ncbi:MAG: SoxR reducing system RseC family protein [Spirochaetales bacterium]|nr:SoxR reducing system RseC family protein [Spirochaetales bacterium]
MTSLERGIVHLALENDLLCAGCSTGTENSGGAGGRAAGCSVCGALAGDKQRTIQADNPANLHLEVGDRVVVALDNKKTVTAALLVFVLPVAAFLLGYAALLLLVPSAREGTRLLGGAAGFVLAVVFAFVWRMIRKKKDWPQVMEKIGTGLSIG